MSDEILIDRNVEVGAILADAVAEVYIKGWRMEVPPVIVAQLLLREAINRLIVEGRLSHLSEDIINAVKDIKDRHQGKKQ